jgi:pimeloyl-ACP methyl ester carboxylesterase
MTAAAAIEIRSRWIELDAGTKLHVLEAGEGEPLILLHGSGNNSASWIPLIERLPGRRLIAVDRPGYGRSPAVGYQQADYRQTAVSVVTDLLDALELESGDLVGNSTGSIWALWTAMDQPQRVRRLVLLGATPLLPGTSPPIPLRLMTTPLLGDLLAKLMPDPSPESVIKMMGGMGERDSIAQYPRLVDVFVAAGSDPVAAEASQSELSVMIRGLAGFRRKYRFTHEQLTRVSQPSLLIWGNQDPIGDLDAARQADEALSQAQLEILPTGHAPWWGETDQTATLITNFLSPE